MSNSLRKFQASAVALAASALAAPVASAQVNEVIRKLEAQSHGDYATPEDFSATRITVNCSSGDYERVVCRLPRDFDPVDARVLRRHSSADCDRGRDWDLTRGQLWVKDGCRADFEVFSARPRDYDLIGGPGYRRRGDEDRDWRDDRLDTRHAIGLCARAAVREAWRSDAWSAQYESEPRVEWGRRGAEVTGRVRVHHDRGFYSARATCLIRNGQVLSFDLR
ncbi:DUF3011 domain-containing protein [bacterium]|nr:DUF3011 domain-containing protein [bacterium]